MQYTPRQVAAYSYIALLRRKQERADDLVLSNAAARGDPRAVRALARKMSKE